MTPPAAGTRLRVATFDRDGVGSWWDLTRGYRDAQPLLTNVLSSVAALPDQHVPGASGPAPAVAAFAAAVAQSCGRQVEPRRRELLRVLGDYTPPAAVPGAPRRASAESPADLAAAAAVMGAFHREVGQAGEKGETEFSERMRRSALERLRLGGWWWWEVDGAPVASAAHAPLVDIGEESAGGSGRVGRVGPVWTAPEHRRKGYAAAVTGAVTEALLGECSVVMLYTDADNATSNGVYARLGYEVVAELVAVNLQP